MRRTTHGLRGTSTGLTINHRLSTLLFIVAIGIIAISLSTAISNQHDKDEIPGINPPALRASGANIQISSFTSDRSVYVAGMMMQLSVTVQNTGDVAATNVMVSVSFGGYSGLPPSASSGPYSIAAGSFSTAMIMTGIFASGGTANVTLTASASGQESGTGDPVESPTSSITVRIQSQAIVSIINLAISPWAPYVGQPFSLTATFINIGDTAATVDATLDDGSYQDLTWDDPAAITVPAANINTQVFSVLIALASTPNASVDIHVTWTGTEAISGRAMSGDIPIDSVLISTCNYLNLYLTNLAVSPTSPFVAGSSFTLTVTFVNMGGLSATVDASIDDGTYTGLSWNDPAAVLVNGGGGTTTQQFTMTIAAGAATNASVDIHVTWNGTEAITEIPISGDTPIDQILVSIQAQANVYVDTVAVNATQGYPNRWVLATVTVRNSGDTAISNGSVVLTFNSTYAINPTEVNQSTGLAIPANGHIGVRIKFQISVSGPFEYYILVDASFTGNEAISGRSLTDSMANTYAVVYIHVPIIIVSTTIPSGRFSYVRGESFMVRATIDNSAGADPMTNGTLVLDFNGANGFSVNCSYGGLEIISGAVIVRDFLVTTSAGADASCLIRAHFTCAFTFPLDEWSNTILVTTQAPANVAITNLTVTPAGPYIAGMSFTLTVTYSNTGGTGATVDGTCNAQTYTFLMFSDPAAITVNAASTNTQVFTVTIAAAATTNASADIHVTWSGYEFGTGRPISGDTPINQLLVSIQAQAAVSITGLSVAPAGPYAGGMSFTLTVTYGNTGGTTGTVTAICDDGTYTGLTFVVPAAVTVNPAGTNTQAVTVNIAAVAGTNASVDIHVTWSGNEAISYRAISGDAPVDQILLSIQAQANAYVDTVVVNATYAPPNSWVMATVMVRNSGGTAVSSGSVALSFNDTVNAINPTAVNQSTGLTIPAGGKIGVQIKFQISAGPPNGTTIRIDATFIGTEQFSGRAVLDTTANSPAIVHAGLFPPPFILISIRGGHMIYVRGEEFVVRAIIDNSDGGTVITGGSLSLDFGGASGFTRNMTTVPEPIAIGAIVTRDFLVTILISAAALCNIRVNFTGYNPAEFTHYSDTIAVTTQAQASVAITGLSISPAGTKVGGMSFTLTITYGNAGGTAGTVTAACDDGTYTDLTFVVPAAVVVNPANINTQAVTVNIATTAAINWSVDIHVTWSGTEAISGRAISGDTPIDQILVSIQPRGAISITGLSIAPAGAKVGGMSFTLTVTYGNTGGTAGTVTAACTAGTYVGLTFVVPTAVTVNPGVPNTQAVTVNIAAGAGANASVDIHVTWSGTEAISGRAILGDIPVDQILVSIQARAAVSITFISTIPAGPYVAGTSFTLTVTYGNTGGTAATVDGACTAGTYTSLTFSNPPAVTVVAGGTVTQDFTVTIAENATTNASVAIRVTWSGTEQYSNRPISGDTPTDQLLVGIQSHAALLITSLSVTPPGVLVAGMMMQVSVTVQNTGGTTVNNVIVALTFSGYPGLSSTQSPPSMLTSGSSTTRTFTVTIPASGPTAGVTITASASGQEAGTGDPINAPPRVIIVQIQAQANVMIVNFTTSPSQSYAGGDTFSLIVTFANTGGTAATVDAIIDESASMSLTWNDPSPVTVGSSSTTTQTFTVTVNASAPCGSLILPVTWAGTESISCRALSGDIPIDEAWIMIECRSISITNLAVAPASSFVAGTSFTLTVTFINLGGIGATVDASIDDGSYTGLSWTDEAPILVHAGGSNVQMFTMTIAPGVATNASVDIHVTWNGTEAVTGFPISGDSPIDQILVSIQSQAAVSITSLSASPAGPYLAGQNFTITITYGNTGGTAGMVTAACDDGTYTGLTFVIPAAVTVNPGDSNVQVVTVNIAAGASANASVNIQVIWTGTEAVSGRTLSGDSPANAINVSINIYADIVITTILDITAMQPYTSGESFVARVHVQNTGTCDALDLAIVLDYNGYLFLSSNASTPFTLASQATAHVDFLIAVAPTMTDANVSIGASFTCVEQYSGRIINGSLQKGLLSVTIEGMELPVALFDLSSATIPINELVSFTERSYDPDGQIVSWSWDFGDGETSSRRNCSHAYREPGQYTIRLVVTDAQGLSATTTITVTVTSPLSRSEILITTGFLGIFLAIGAIVIMSLRKKKVKRDWIEA